MGHSEEIRGRARKKRPWRFVAICQGNEADAFFGVLRERGLIGGRLLRSQGKKKGGRPCRLTY